MWNCKKYHNRAICVCLFQTAKSTVYVIVLFPNSREQENNMATSSPDGAKAPPFFLRVNSPTINKLLVQIIRLAATHLITSSLFFLWESVAQTAFVFKCQLNNSPCALALVRTLTVCNSLFKCKWAKEGGCRLRRNVSTHQQAAQHTVKWVNATHKRDVWRCSPPPTAAEWRGSNSLLLRRRLTSIMRAEFALSAALSCTHALDAQTHKFRVSTREVLQARAFGINGSHLGMQILGLMVGNNSIMSGRCFWPEY